MSSGHIRKIKKKKKVLTMHMHLENSAVCLLPRNCNQKEAITEDHILKTIHLPANRFYVLTIQAA